ncbi:hypothetical protein T8K17_21580 [Thalassobaculum sp. OXR-137]|uniref:hypothetical protein n=1 Tax=Thalassobaculum sp. OXR-137 TaxID=3100173 RepID=UPI002AC9EA76|nr:hypothetical protein [Thalassobaculum sp. OXR-137]WPZ33817.1 hypothetical protein T8K17_21580 [Thalassobaculum sp. OXR-137]
MPQGTENLHLAETGSVDPLLLAIVCVIFVIGAVVPIAAAILSSMREDRDAKRAALATPQVSNPVADNVVLAVEVMELEPVDTDMLGEAANDQPTLRAVAGGR